MDSNSRKNLIETGQLTGASSRLWVLGQWQNLPVRRVSVSDLTLNIDNRRFAAERQLFEQQLGHSLDPENSEEDALSIESILLDRDLQVDGNLVIGQPGKDYLALKLDWLRRNQETPFWVLADGTVRNGNRRLAMLRRLIREEGSESYGHVDAVVLDEFDEITIFEMEQREQLTEDYKVRYTDINLLLAIKDAADDKNIDWYDTNSIQSVASELQHVMRNDTKYAVVQLYAIKYMDAYLQDLDEDGRYDKLIGQIERFRDVGRFMRSIEEEDASVVNYVLQVLFAAVNSGMTHLDIRKIRRLFDKDRDGFNLLAISILDAEKQWEQPSEGDVLRTPEKVDDEMDDSENPTDEQETPGPSVTNYPKEAVRDIFEDAFDRHESEQVSDVLKIVREINNRLNVLIGNGTNRLDHVLNSDENSKLRESINSMLSWFDENQTFLRK